MRRQMPFLCSFDHNPQEVQVPAKYLVELHFTFAEQKALYSYMRYVSVLTSLDSVIDFRWDLFQAGGEIFRTLI